VEICCRDGQATDDNMARALCMLVRLHTHTLRIPNTCCFSSATMGTGRCLNATFMRILCIFFYYVGWRKYALQQPSQRNITFVETLHIGAVGTLTF